MGNDEQWLVSVTAGAWQLAGMRAAQSAGIRIFAVDGNGDAPGLKEADKFDVVDIRDPVAVVDAVRRSGIRPTGAVSFVSEVGMRGAAAVRDAFDLPGPGLSLVEALIDKGAQRSKWQKAGLPVPDWSVVKPPLDNAIRFSFDNTTVIVKPVDAAGGRGISVVKPGGDIRAAILYALTFSMKQEAIVETFIVGQEYTVESISTRGRHYILAVTEKHKFPDMNETVSSEIVTLPMDDPLVAEIADLAARAYDALSYRDGPGHMEILRDRNCKLWLVEAAGRAGGVMISEGLVPLATGFDQQKATALSAVGQPVTIPDKFFVKDTILRWLLGRPGVFVKISGQDRANAIDGVICGPLIQPGATVKRANNDDDRIGYILASGASRSEAAELADRAEREISLIFKEE